MAHEFVHLHLHTDYSMLDGACDVEKLIAHVKKIGQPAVAVTDHGNIYGAVHFFNAAKDKGIKPILGCELYICKKDDHRAPPEGDTYNHLLVLAENEEGYRNLVKIVSEASLNGFYYKPRISKKFLADHAKGLIGLSACLKGEVAERLTEGNYAAAREAATTFGDIFGKNNFYLEIQDQGLEQEKRIQQGLLDLEKEIGFPLVATNDSHYLCDDDSHAQDVMVCIQTGKSIHDTNRMKFQTDQFFVKSAAEMAKMFNGIERVLSRTMEIAERCNLKLEKVKNPFPKFEVPEGMSIDSYFEDVVRKGMARRMVHLREVQAAGRLRHSFADYEERLNFEIDTVKKMQFPGYFLIVWDFIRYAKENNIPVGPGRGSAAGSLVAYAMAITDIDPLQNNLLFQRFLNPERISMPDIDVDFCMNRRGEVIKYVTEKYGRDQVAQIITFGTMAAKAAIKDCGRAMDLPYAEVDRVAKMVPAAINITIDGALKDSPMLAQAYENEPQTKELIDTAKRLEGLVRNSGVHAAGVVIASQPLTDLVPLHRTKNDEIVTAYDMKAVEKMGLLKMDFLGLTTLTIIDDSLKLIQQTKGEAIQLEKLPLDDKQTYERVFHTAYTSGVFQFESSGMRDVLRRYKPNTVEDLTALNALYRPGPLQGGMVDDFIERKWGRRKIDYFHDDLRPILEETLGVIVYQEQVMQIANKLAGYSLGEADLLRRAMGKKDPHEMEKQRDRFVKGAIERGYGKDLTVHIFDLMQEFAGYGFNKSHSAAYALLAYHTAYLKTHYPIEFMAALLTSVSGSTDDVVKYINECRDMGIPVEAPDVNVSLASFTPHGEAILFGLSAIKNLGHNAIESIVKAREDLGKFSSFFQFCEKVDLRLLNKRVVESLIKSGAMDCLGRRSQLFAVIDRAMDHAQKVHRDAESGQHGLFGVFDDGKPDVQEQLPNVPDWDEHQRLASEKEVLGFFISGHPMEKYKDKLEDFQALTTDDLKAMKSSSGKDESYVGGIMGGVKVARSKKGDLYALGTLEDMHGAVSFLCFADNYKRLADKLKLEVPVLLKGAIRIEEEQAPKIMVSEILTLETAQPRLARNVRVRIPLNAASQSTIDALHAVFQECKGPAKVLFDLEMEGDFMVVMEAESYNVLPDRAFVRKVEELCGRGAVRAID